MSSHMPMTIDPAGQQYATIDGYQKLNLQKIDLPTEVQGLLPAANGGTGLLRKYFTGNLPAAQGGQTIFSLDSDILTANIKNLFLLIDWSGTGAWMGANYTPNAGYEANVYCSNGAPVSALVTLSAANSFNIVNNAFILTVEYTV